MTETRSMNIVDAATLGMETEYSLMHMGGASVFRLPKGAAPDFVARIYNEWRSYPVERAPFTFRLARKRRGVFPSWEVLDKVELQHHLYHVRLPNPGSDRQFTDFIGQLHSKQMDRSRPMWEVYLIEGLSKHRFATYTRFHHALFDGVSAVRILGQQYATRPDEHNHPPPWAAVAREKNRHVVKRTERESALLSRLTSSASGGYKTLRKTLDNATDFGALVRAFNDFEWPDFNAPNTIFNQPVTTRTELGVVSFPFSRFKQLSKSAGGTINDVLLTICGGALRRFLTDIGELPDSSLVCSVPVALNKEGNEEGGNTVSLIPAAIGTHLAKTEDRFEAVQASIAKGKAMLIKMPTPVKNIYMGGLMGLMVIESVRNKPLLKNPLFNLIITNVPGNRDPAYLNGAELDFTLPISAIRPGMALNFVVTSMGDELCLGFACCPDVVPGIDRLGPMLKESFADLEATVGKRLKHDRRGKRNLRRKSVQRASRSHAAKTPNVTRTSRLNTSRSHQPKAKAATVRGTGSAARRKRAVSTKPTAARPHSRVGRH